MEALVPQGWVRYVLLVLLALIAAGWVGRNERNSVFRYLLNRIVNLLGWFGKRRFLKLLMSVHRDFHDGDPFGPAFAQDVLTIEWDFSLSDGQAVVKRISGKLRGYARRPLLETLRSSSSSFMRTRP